MDNNFKILIGSVIATIVIIVVAVFLFSSNGDTPTTADAAPIDSQILVRDNGYNTKGPSDAQVTLVEFADFQCPGCKATTGVLKAISQKYPTQVRIVYRHFPLPQHPLAQPAAAAAEAAGAQGKFWEMHDLIFANQED